MPQQHRASPAALACAIVWISATFLACSAQERPEIPSEDDKSPANDASVKADSKTSVTGGNQDAGPTPTMPDAAMPDRTMAVGSDAAPMVDARAGDAAGPTTAANPGIGIAFKQGSDSRQVSLWIPSGVKSFRGLVIGGMDDVTGKEPYQSWQLMCEQWGFAYVGSNLRFFSSDIAIFLGHLETLAKMKGHPELVNVPFLCKGFSRAGGDCIRLATVLPDRVLAVVSNGNPGTGFDPKDAPAFLKVPVMTVLGSKDPFTGTLTSNSNWLKNHYIGTIRPQNLLWSVSVNWGEAHRWADTNHILYPFFDRIVSARLPKDYDGTKGPAALTTLSFDSGWLGDIRGWLGAMGTDKPRTIAPSATFDGDKAMSSWLMDPVLAAAWRVYNVSPKTMKLTNLPTSDNTVTRVPATGTLDVGVMGAPDGAILWAGNKQVATVQGGNAKVAPGTLPLGYSLLYFTAKSPEGADIVSQLTQVYVTP